ncbi:MAG: hypothetical protein FJ290_10585 [Planctomycetes bacterium]|nr:hypothetical protein [Planctomycetota bacterium]
MGRIVRIEGSPREAGRCYGELAAAALRQRVAEMWEAGNGSRWGPAQLDERGERFRGYVERIAPEWLDEAEAIAAAAGINVADLFALNALPPGFWKAPGSGCTSCLVVGSHSATGHTLLHKNRDLVNSTQDFHVRRTADGWQLFASRDMGSLGLAHFQSDRALAGANNTGSYIKPEELRDCGLTCTDLLRLVAERASTCDEALALLEEAIAREVAGGSGHGRGMIFLFAEPGKGLLVEMTSMRLAHREVRDDTLIRTNHFLLDEMLPTLSEPPQRNTLRRYERAHELLDPLPLKNLADLVRLSRDHNDGPDSICSDNWQHTHMTVSACTHSVRPDTNDPIAHTRVQMGNTRNTIAVPVPRAIDGLPTECVDGTMHNLARKLYARHGVGDHLAQIQEEQERSIAREFAQVGAAAKFADPDRLREHLTEFTARTVARVRTALEGLLA